MLYKSQEKWTESQKEIFWNKLFNLAMQKPKRRAYSLAQAFESEDYSPEKMVVLYESVLKYAPEIYVAGLNYTREDVENGLS